MRRTILLVILLLAACQTTQLEDPENVTQFFDDDELVRPDFNRTPHPDLPELNETVIEPIPNNQSVFLTTYEGATQLRIPINYPLGWAWPILSMDEIPLLRPAPIKTGDNQVRGYRQFIYLEFNATGNVSFLVDETRKPDYAGTVLRFDADEPYFAYLLRLNDRAFFDPTIIGTNIQLLGSTFQIMDATNNTLQLNGLDVSQYLRISNGERLETNKKKISDSIVQYDGFDFGYLLTAPSLDTNGFWLREGETIKERLREEKQTESFIGDFDIRYDGLELLNPELIWPITFKARDEYIELIWEAPDGIVKIPVLGTTPNGTLWHGNQENRAHFVECADRNTGCIVEEDLIILYGRLPTQGTGPFTTKILELTGFDLDERKIMFRDTVTRERVSTDWVGNISDSRYPARAHILFLDHEYDIYVHGHEEERVDPENASRMINVTVPESISMDLDGNGGIRGDHVPLIISDGIEVWLDNILANESNTNYTLNITIEAGRYDYKQLQYRDGIINKEVLVLQAVAQDGVFSVRIPTDPDALWDHVMQEEPGGNEKYAFGMSPWGTFVTLELDDDVNPQETTEEILFEIPLVQRFALVSVGLLK